MSGQLNLKEIERKAFRSTYQDGLWDINLGLIIAAMSIFVYRPETGYSPVNIVFAILMITAANLVYQAGKKRITVPRMGQVRFGEVRKRKAKTLAVVLGVFVLLQVGLVLLTAFGWANPSAGSALEQVINQRVSSRLLVSAIGSLIVGTSMIVIAYFSDFPRGYYIGLMMALAVFLMIYFNRPIYPIIIGALILIPGVVLLVRFLKAYPLHPEDAIHG